MQFAIMGSGHPALVRRPVELIPEHELNRHMRDRVLKEAVAI